MGERSGDGRLAGWVSHLGALSDSPRRTAVAFAIGVFLSFSPFFGLQIATGVIVALALRLNRIAILVGLCANLPWFMVPWYALTTAAGAVMLGVPLAGDVRARVDGLLELPVYRAAFWERAAGLVQPFVWPFVLGSTLGALLIAIVAYAIMSRVMVRIRASKPVG